MRIRGNIFQIYSSISWKIFTFINAIRAARSMSSESLFNKLWVIESLLEGDLKTGQNLVDNQLAQAKRSQPDLIVSLERPDTKKRFLKLLGEIRDQTQNDGLYPMLHFECHGCPDGLVTASDELVAWDDLRETLIEINYACRLNLVITLAACNGAHLIRVATKLDKAPFWAIIGTEVEVTAGNVEHDFGAFYSTFFKSLDGDAAVAALNKGNSGSDRQYHFWSAAGLFLRAYARYHKVYCVGKGRRERVENIVTQAMQNPNIRSRGVSWARKKVKEGLSNGEMYFNKKKERFFFIDQFPENAQRFPLTYSDVLAKIKP